MLIEIPQRIEIEGCESFDGAPLLSRRAVTSITSGCDVQESASLALGWRSRDQTSASREMAYP